MKTIICILALLSFSKNSISQTPVVLYTVEESYENKKDIFAIPFVIYKKGKYIDPPICISYEEEQSKKECIKAKNVLLPFVKKGTLLYSFKVGKRLDIVHKIQSSEFYICIYSGKLKTKSSATILTNSSKIGTQVTKKIKTLPTLKETQFEGVYSTHTLIGRIDIDGNGTAEMIYRCDANQASTVYEIYSFKKNSWKLVYKGGSLDG